MEFQGLYKKSKKLQSLVKEINLFSTFTQTKLTEGISSEKYSPALANSVNSRKVIWYCSIATLKTDNHWLWGVGTGDVQDHLTNCYKDKNKYLYEHREFNAHNEYLQTFVRNGIFGLLSLLGIILLLSKAGLQHKSYVYLGFLIFFLISNLTESMLSRQAGVIFFTCFNSLFVFTLFNKK